MTEKSRIRLARSLLSSGLFQVDDDDDDNDDDDDMNM
jgi:hypothetical protein